MTNKNPEAYIKELEHKIVDLTIELKCKKNELVELNKENCNHLKKLVHNLKNPVGVAYSFSEMIVDSGREISAEKLEKYITVIKNSTKFTLDTLEEVANLSRLKNTEFTLNFEQINFVNLIEKVLNSFKTNIEDNNISVVRSFPNKNLLLAVDTAEMEQVFKNLIKNALQFSAKNTTIKILITETQNTVETTIVDEGIGISATNLPLIFNEFFVVNTYTESNNKCIGMGLAIAKKIANLHKGTIEVTSSLNKGSSFKVVLPKK